MRYVVEPDGVHLYMDDVPEPNPPEVSEVSEQDARDPERGPAGEMTLQEALVIIASVARHVEEIGT